MPDSLQRFIFENANIRGEIVKLDATWQAILSRHDYPQSVQTLLGEMMVAAALLSATLKFNGKLIIQIQGGHPIKLMVVECDSNNHLRAVAQYDDDIQASTKLSELVGAGKLVITLDPATGGERYQSIVDITGESLADAITDYLVRSEQLDTNIWLAANSKYAAGLLIQKLPNDSASLAKKEPSNQPNISNIETNDQDTWNRIQHLSSTITNDELLNISEQEIIHRLYHEEDVRVFDKEPISFRCTCSRERVATMLRSLGSKEVVSIIEEQKIIKVACEFCNQKYEFDSVDSEQLFASDIPHTTTSTKH
ncbi:33 kDa chaperonin HslO [hydrothermal vent metagenome]|uniref:33 kDa chaperonin HslO n=1 Tax=hydrothermal vent metagenome TaxID=652676 RepID=A0A3B1A660_9ZZZZ